MEIIFLSYKSNFVAKIAMEMECFEIQYMSNWSFDLHNLEEKYRFYKKIVQLGTKIHETNIVIIGTLNLLH